MILEVSLQSQAKLLLRRFALSKSGNYSKQVKEHKVRAGGTAISNFEGANGVHPEKPYSLVNAHSKATHLILPRETPMHSLSIGWSEQVHESGMYKERQQQGKELRDVEWYS